MGSLHQICRLCAAVAPEDQQVKIFSEADSEAEVHSLASKLRFFLNLNLAENHFSEVACCQCVQNLEFCIQVRLNLCIRGPIFALRFASSLTILYQSRKMAILVPEEK